MSIPTIVFSAYGMNLNPSGMPFSSIQWGFLIVILLSIVASIVAAIFLSKKKYFYISSRGIHLSKQYND